MELRTGAGTAGRIYPWLVFALAFGLLLADYMSRQVLSAVFPFLKDEWALSDSRLGSLNSVVALMVGILTLPLSVLADRWGRTRSLVLMAVLWSIATLLCALATGYDHMLAARFFVGVGEAAYGSVGIALVLGIFAAHRHAALSGAFMAGGSFGSVLGVSLGGVIAVHLGWRWAFATMAIAGLVLAVVFRALVSDAKLSRYAVEAEPSGSAAADFRAPVSTLFTNPAVLCAYAGSALQIFTAAVLLSWLPSFFNRSYGLAPDRAAAVAAAFVLLVGAGMVGCGVVTDRVGRADMSRKWTAAIVFCLISLICLTVGFTLDTGPLQLTLIGIGALFSGGSSGPTAAMVANLTHASVRASAMGTLTLANSLFGLALGPFVVGVLADSVGLPTALSLAPLTYVAAIAALILGRRLYPAGLRRRDALGSASPDDHPALADAAPYRPRAQGDTAS
ncbi:MFS transporter [Nocardia mexicana]|uniref:Putative MFS family arabinose efflux permease n=1 Tax=Nocardia mexicana TaxID=279262 RepID=A0A370GMM5_9NOCA|nr:MFS transporter [Nocardia mexicana]RDI44897.1 putative MFS family arabinose efflux permease [Nocardia mexicana]